MVRATRNASCCMRWARRRRRPRGRPRRPGSRPAAPRAPDRGLSSWLMLATKSRRTASSRWRSEMSSITQERTGRPDARGTVPSVAVAGSSETDAAERPPGRPEQVDACDWSMPPVTARRSARSIAEPTRASPWRAAREARRPAVAEHDLARRVGEHDRPAGSRRAPAPSRDSARDPAVSLALLGRRLASSRRRPRGSTPRPIRPVQRHRRRSADMATSGRRSMSSRPDAAPHGTSAAPSGLPSATGRHGRLSRPRAGGLRHRRQAARARPRVLGQPAGDHVADPLADVHGVVADALVVPADQGQLHGGLQIEHARPGGAPGRSPGCSPGGLRRAVVEVVEGGGQRRRPRRRRRRWPGGTAGWPPRPSAPIRPRRRVEARRRRCGGTPWRC